MVLHGFVGLIMWAIGSQSPWEEHIVIFRSTDRILNPKTLNPHIPNPKALNIVARALHSNLHKPTTAKPQTQNSWPSTLTPEIETSKSRQS